MRYLLLSVLVVCVIGVMVSTVFEAYGAVGSLGDEHEHASLLVRIFGDKFDFSAAFYQIKSSWIHFEERDGNTIHRHASGVTLDDLFDSLRMEITSERFVFPDGRQFITNDDYSLKYYINGKLVNSINNYVINDDDRILITFGGETDQQIQEQLKELNAQVIKSDGGSLVSSSPSNPPLSDNVLPPGVKGIAPNFEGDSNWTVTQLYQEMENPKKDYDFDWGNAERGFSTDPKMTKIIGGDGKDLLVFDLLLENKGTTPIIINLYDVKVYDGKDRKFTPITSTTTPPFGDKTENPNFSWWENCPENYKMSVQPGLEGKMKVCFEIPKDADHFKVLVFDSTYSLYRGNLALTFDKASIDIWSSENENAGGSSDGGGCLIATAAFGSEMAPQVQFLRELRDNTVLQTESGTSFMAEFNQFYYSFSPYIADYERENPAFKEAVKLTVTPLLASLTLLNYVDIDSEEEMLGYGIGVILLNIGMYFVAPAVLIMAVRKRI